MQRERKNPVRGEYIRSFLLTVVCAGIVVGLLLMLLSVTSMRRAEQEETKARLMLAADDMEQQLAQIELVTKQIRITQVYQPFYLLQNPFYRTELVENFRQFGTYSPILKEYYLLYTDTRDAFSGASHWDARYFCQLILRQPASAWEEIKQVSSACFLPLEGRPEDRLLVLPFHIGSSSDSRGEARLLVLLSTDQFQERIRLTSGLKSLPGLTLSVDGKNVLNGPWDANDTFAMSAEGRVSLSVSYGNSDYSPNILLYQRTATVLIAAMLLIFGALAVWTALRRYRPIRQLHAYVDQGRQSSDEIKDIERMLRSAVDERASTQKKIDRQVAQLEAQQDWLIQQQVLLLINGESGSQLMGAAERANANLQNRFFAVCCLRTPDETGPDFFKKIRELSNEEMTFGIARLSERSQYVILINLEDGAQLQDAIYMLVDIFESMDMEFSLHPSGLGEKLRDIPNLALEALSAPPCYDTRLERGEVQPDPKEAKEDRLNLERLFCALDAHSEEKALCLLDGILEDVEKRWSSVLFQTHIVADIWRRMLGYALKNGLSRIADTPAPGIGSDMDEVRRQMRGLIHQIIIAGQEKEDGETGVSIQEELPAYIEAHALENSISQASAAEAFRISLRQVARVLKNAGKPPFREYIILLRIEAAKKMLREPENTIAETAEKTGYGSVSHFVRAFRENTGMTPGEYRKSVIKRR